MTPHVMKPVVRRQTAMLPWIGCLFVLWGGSLSRPTSALASDEEPRRWAILIGVDEYSHARDLRYCGADQRALRKRLIAAGFADRRVYLLDDSASEKRNLPFKSNIQHHLQLILGLIEPGDLVVIAFSGHGVHVGGKSYLCPTDGRLAEPDTLLALDDVYEQVKRCRAALKLLVVDACRNDPTSEVARTLQQQTNEFNRSLDRLPEGIVLLSSCAEGEISYEDPELGHGVFMHYLLEGLGGKADRDNDGNVSLFELSRFAGDQTAEFVAHAHRDSQRPKLRGDTTIDALRFSLSRVPAGTTLENAEVSAGGRPSGPAEAMRPEALERLTRFGAVELFGEPSAHEWDKQGRLWMTSPKAAELQNLRLLEDSDGDGRWDRATVFAEGLQAPYRLRFQDGGVVVEMKDKTILLKDTDGDRRADARSELPRGQK